MTHVLAFDWETHLIGGNERTVCQCGEVHSQFPPAVCLSWARCDGSSGLVLPREGLQILWEAVNDTDCHLVGHETAFDVLVACHNAKRFGHDDFDHWIMAWVDAYDSGRVHDTGVRQKLLNLACDKFKWHRHSNGYAEHVGYDLASVSRRNGGPHLDKQDEWRTKYATLDGVPVEQWPDAAREYPVLDAVGTIWSYEAQNDWPETTNILERWEGFVCYPDGSAPNPLADEHAQTCHALWLKAMSGEGIGTDYEAIKKYEARARKEYSELCVETFRYGLTRREYWRDVKGLKALGHELRLSKIGNALWKELKSAMDLDDSEAWEYWNELAAKQLVSLRYARNTKHAQACMLEVCEKEGLPVPRTDGWKKAEIEAKRGLRARPEYDEYVAIDADACRVSQDPRLLAYADLTHQAKILSADIPQLMIGIERPIHSHFDSLKETGRISSSDPNITNRARGEEDHAGDRECFVPPEGYVLIDYDFSQLELFCMAQNDKWLLGSSSLGDALLNDLDAHVDLAADIAGITYAEALKRHKAKNLPERQAAKGYNFGRRGGLGTRTFVSYAAKSYGVVRTKEEWDDVFEIGDAKWVETPRYFEFINSLVSPVDAPVIDEERGGRPKYKYNVVQPWSGRLRASVDYTVACNSFYQGLGSDVAKLAGWFLFKACYVPGVDPVLFGCRIVNFIHDQFLIIALEARAAAAAKRVEYWCGLAARQVLPDYGHKMAEKSEAILARRWSKQAQRVENERGELIAWEDERLAG